MSRVTRTAVSPPLTIPTPGPSGESLPPIQLAACQQKGCSRLLGRGRAGQAVLGPVRVSLHLWHTLLGADSSLPSPLQAQLSLPQSASPSPHPLALPLGIIKMILHVHTHTHMLMP